MGEATPNQLRAERLIESIFSSDPDLAKALHAKAEAIFGEKIATPRVAATKAAIVEPEVARLENDLKASKEQLAKALERLDARDKKEADDKAFSDMKSSVDSAVKKFGLTEEGKNLLLDRMKETGNYTDPEAAAALIVHQHPPISPSPSWAPHNADYYGTKKKDENFELLHKDPEGFRDDHIARFLKDPEAYRNEAA